MKEPFGTALGENQGVIGYSNAKNGRHDVPEIYIHNVYTGVRYQCVEYARRWLLTVKGLTFEDVMCAGAIWNFDHVTRVVDNQKVPLLRVPNGSPAVPQVGALLIYKRRLKTPVGHIAIITDVDIDGKYVRISEQNVDEVFWPGNYARQLELECLNGKYFIRDQYSLDGWMVYEDYPELPEEKCQCEVV